MFNDIKWFLKFNKYPTPIPFSKSASGDIIYSEGTGIIRLIIKRKDYTLHFQLEEVALVPRSPANLVSIGKLKENLGYYYDGKTKVVRTAKDKPVFKIN